MVLVPGAWWRRAIGVVAVVVASEARAVPLATVVPGAVGEPLRQTFIDDDASHVRTETGFACVTSRPIDIVASTYLDPETQGIVPFAEVIRSHAASAQFVATLPDNAESFRVQLKYSPRPGEPITLDIGGLAIDARAMLEPSGDSIRITAPVLLRAIRHRLENGQAILLTATSRDTGRTVTDRIEAMRFAAYDACRAGTPPAPAEPPSNRIAFDFEATQDPARRATDIEANTCRIEDPDTELYRGRLLWTTGFFAQTQDIFVTFGDDGEVAEVYVPGIVEGRRRPDGVMATHLSIAANGNDPTRLARVSGCLGSAPVALCAQPDGGYGECIGALAGTDLFEDAAFLSNFEMGNDGRGNAGLLTRSTGSSTPIVAASLSGIGSTPATGGGLFGGGGPGTGQPLSGPPSGGPGPTPPVPPAPPPTNLPIIPLPLSALLLITGVALLVGASRRRGQADAANYRQCASGVGALACAP